MTTVTERLQQAGDGRRRRSSLPAAAAVLLLLAAAAWGGSSVAVASSSHRPARSLVGVWQRVTHCQDLVRALTDAGFEDHVLEAAGGDGFIPGVTSGEEIADPTHPCRGAVPRRHSHFFTPDGFFGSLDWNGNQVDEGPYEFTGNDSFVMPCCSEEAFVEITFHYRIDGNNLRLDPVIPSDCSASVCREAAAWSITVALPGKTWRRVG